ncbi:MAG TPA: formate/nitrite transporter family protein [Actinomycetota bacterium]|nr:formate/nitrite transporter family protein [Actinomycetota bacterium]
MNKEPDTAGPTFRIDAYRPEEMARMVRDRAPAKVTQDAITTVGLGILAGAFVGVGAAFATATMTGPVQHYGMVRFLGGLAFSTGFILVLVGGGQLFTSNSLVVMAWASHVVTLRQLLRNWLLVWIGNLIGAVSTAFLFFASGQALLANGGVGATALSIANLKAGRSFGQAVIVGLLGNGLVCLAVWLSYSAHSTTDRVIAVIPPIVAMMALNVDHAVGTMYFLSMGMLVGGEPQVLEAARAAGLNFQPIAWEPALGNLAAVTAGNILGGGLLVSAFYWFLYLRRGVLREPGGPSGNPLGE